MLIRRVLIVAALISIAADKPKRDPVKEDLAKLQGTWHGVYFEQNGKYLPAGVVKKARIVLTISEDSYTFSSAQKNAKGSIYIDPTKKPKTIDNAANDEKHTTTLQGIYYIEGDNLWICGGPTRPKGFTTMNNGASMIRFARAKQ